VKASSGYRVPSSGQILHSSLKIAFDSRKVSPSTTRNGIYPEGLSFRISGCWCSPLGTSTFTNFTFSFYCASSALIARELASPRYQ
jgi:hypothetical protein